jgi:IMP cyclohydrolase
MTRYVVLSGGFYVGAVQADTRHIWLTKEKEEAGSWSVYERAVKAARFVEETTGDMAIIQAVEEPNYPKSWGVAKKDA